MRRRSFIQGIAASTAWPLAARAQQSATPVIGYLGNASPEAFVEQLRGFRQGLSESGYVEGRNLAIEFRWAQNDFDRLPQLAADLVHREVSVIVAVGNGDVALAAKAATTSIPVVFVIGADPVRLGLVTSLNRPGSNITGITGIAADLVAKQIGLLHEFVPSAKRVAVLVNPGSAQTKPIVSEAMTAAAAIGLEIETLNAANNRDIEAAFSSLIQTQAAALLVTADSLFISRRMQLALLAIKQGIPIMASFRTDVQAGELMSYGPSVADVNRQAAIYAARILKGEKPADLPVMQASKFEFVINLQAARIMGVEIPANLLARADEVIE